MGQILGTGRAPSPTPPLLMEDVELGDEQNVVDEEQQLQVGESEPILGAANPAFDVNESSSDSEGEEAAAQLSRGSTPEPSQDLVQRTVSCCVYTGGDGIDELPEDEGDSQPQPQVGETLVLGDNGDDILSLRQIRKVDCSGDGAEMLTSQAMSDAAALIENANEDNAEEVHTPLSTRKVVIVIAIALILLFFGLGLGLGLGLRNRSSDTTSNATSSRSCTDFPHNAQPSHPCPNANASMACAYESGDNVTEWHGSASGVSPTVIGNSSLIPQSDSCSGFYPEPNPLGNDCSLRAVDHWGNVTQAVEYIESYPSNYTQGQFNASIPAIKLMSAMYRAMTMMQNCTEQAGMAFNLACLWASGGGSGENCIRPSPLGAYRWLCEFLETLGGNFEHLLQAFISIFGSNS